MKLAKKISRNNMPPTLIKCPACNREISDQAVSCPHCGQPLQNREDVVVTIQKTKKRWKLTKFIGGTMVVVFTFVFLGGLADGDVLQMSTGFSLAFIGFIILFIGRIGAWWSTG